MSSMCVYMNVYVYLCVFGGGGIMSVPVQAWRCTDGLGDQRFPSSLSSWAWMPEVGPSKNRILGSWEESSA